MIEFLESYHLVGICIGAITFLTIGLFHPLVIKSEYYLGVKGWWLFLIAGILFMCGSVFVVSVYLSLILSLVAFSSFWLFLEFF